MNRRDFPSLCGAAAASSFLPRRTSGADLPREDDPLDCDLLIADGYAIRDGKATVPDAPGFGLKLDEQKFAATIKPRFDLKA